jgi:hypothetical protein
VVNVVVLIFLSLLRVWALNLLITNASNGHECRSSIAAHRRLVNIAGKTLFVFARTS